MAENTFSIDMLLEQMVAHNASDLHITVGSQPALRVRGHLERMEAFPVMTADLTRQLLYRIISSEQQKRLEIERQLDLSYSIPGRARFRVNIYSQRESLAGERLGGLLDYDKRHGTDLVPTLAAYLDRGGNYDETARALSVHRNTLRYRLARITKISGHDLTDVDTRLNLHLASRAWMERHQPSGQS